MQYHSDVVTAHTDDADRTRPRLASAVSVLALEVGAQLYVDGALRRKMAHASAARVTKMDGRTATITNKRTLRGIVMVDLTFAGDDATSVVITELCFKDGTKVCPVAQPGRSAATGQVVRVVGSGRRPIRNARHTRPTTTVSAATGLR